MKMILIAAGALAVGIALGVLYCESTYRHLRKRLRELRAGQERRNIIRSITRFLFVTASYGCHGRMRLPPTPPLCWSSRSPLRSFPQRPSEPSLASEP